MLVPCAEIHQVMLTTVNKSVVAPDVKAKKPAEASAEQPAPAPAALEAKPGKDEAASDLTVRQQRHSEILPGFVDDWSGACREVATTKNCR